MANDPQIILSFEAWMTLFSRLDAAQEPVYKIERIFDGVKLLRCLILTLVIF